MATDAAELPQSLQGLLDAYTAAYEYYEDDATSNQTRLGHAQALCRALLHHYFRQDEGYAIRNSRLGPMAKYGLNFMLKDADGRSPNFKPLKNPSRDPKLASDRELEYAMREKKWHMILPEDITGFEVSRKAAYGNDDGSTYRPHTYLAIMIDDPKLIPLIADTNDVHRGDILTEVLCSQKIHTGYGLLLYDTRLEIYDYDDGGIRLVMDEHGSGTNITEEPFVKLAQTAKCKDMVFDLKDASLHDLDALLQEVVSKPVKYLT